MFRFTWNHYQTLFKNIDPLLRAIKTRYGIPNVHNHLIFTIHIFLFSNYSIWITVLTLKRLNLIMCGCYTYIAQVY